MKTNLFTKDFMLVVIGQIISLFGNNILRYALPLYLLNQTHSAALFGIVSACSFIPMVLLSPVGGIIADRVNKRNIMVCLDFCTAALMIFYTLFYRQWNLVTLLIVVLMILYGIQGAYQPAVQASIPLLVKKENLMSGNAMINMVNSLAGIVGPVLGGVLLGSFGMQYLLLVSIACFSFSAVMEIFIKIPYVKTNNKQSAFSIAISDMKESFKFIRLQRPEIGRIGLLLACINMFFSALIIIGLPVIINEHLGFSQVIANRFYSYAQSILAIGGLLGAVVSGSIGKKIDIHHSARLIIICTCTLLPIGIVLLLHTNGVIAYIVIALSCLVMMIVSTLLSIILMTYVQQVTPSHLLGKVMSLVTCLVMCAQPLGQIFYGILLETFAANIGGIIFLAFSICLILSYKSNHVFTALKVPSAI